MNQKGSKILPGSCDQPHIPLCKTFMIPACICQSLDIYLYYTTKKETPMIATAIAIQDATASAVHDEMIMDMAGHLYHARNEMTDEEFAQFLFKYSASLSALTATLVTSVCLTESQMNDMVDTIKEFDQLEQEME